MKISEIYPPLRVSYYKMDGFRYFFLLIEKTVLAIQAPADTEISVDNPDMVGLKDGSSISE